MKKYIPIVFFVLLVGLLAFGLTNDPKRVPSPLVDKPAPEFQTTRLYADKKIGTADMRGKVWLLNVFASWCVSCRAEHHILSQFVKQHGVTVVGLNYKDEEADAKNWLAVMGNPYYAIAVDREGKIGMDYGVYGVPETFVIDKKGLIRYKQIGPVTTEAIEETLLPLMKQLQGES